MTRLAIAAMLAFFCPDLHALTIIPTESVELSPADRSSIEKKACRKPYEVRAKQMSGWRLVITSPGYVYASVECESHLTTDVYSLNYQVSCKKRWGNWRCESRELNIRTLFMGQGPRRIMLLEIGPEDALKALRCLETGLRQRPDLVGDEMVAEPSTLMAHSREPTHTPVISAFVSTPIKACLNLTFDRACDANAQVPLEVTSDGCLDE